MENKYTYLDFRIIGMLALACGFGGSVFWSFHWMLLTSVSIAAVYSLIAGFFLFSLLLWAGQSGMTKSKPKDLGVRVLAAGVMPLDVFFLYASKNWELFQFSGCLIVSVGLFCFSIGMYYCFAKYVGLNCATIPLVVLWAMFWFYPYFSVEKKLTSEILYVFLGVVLIILLLLIFRKHELDAFTGFVLSCVIGVSFLYNFASYAYPLFKTTFYRRSYIPKTNFLTDDDRAHPNVYWLHMDGMIGFDAVSNVLNDPQSTFRDALAEKRFVINESAHLDIGWTAYAFPALTSPTFYESYIKGLFDEMRNMSDHERQDVLVTDFSIFDMYHDLDLFHAFEAAGYNDYCLIYDLGRGTENIPKDYRYQNAFRIDKTTNIIDLFANHSCFMVFKSQLDSIYNRHFCFDGTVVNNQDIFDYTNPESDYQFKTIQHYDWMLADDFEELLKLEAPKLIYIQNLLPHFPYNHDENGMEISANGEHDLSNYDSQHLYSVKVLLGMIDRIIATDSDAVIVIQGDHGAHYFEREDFHSQGYTDDEMLELNYSTISAVRIPEKYGVLTEPLDPLDITRYLVNHYVGEGNYEYLYYHEEE